MVPPAWGHNAVWNKNNNVKWKLCSFPFELLSPQNLSHILLFLFSFYSLLSSSYSSSSFFSTSSFTTSSCFFSYCFSSTSTSSPLQVSILFFLSLFPLSFFLPLLFHLLLLLSSYFYSHIFSPSSSSTSTEGNKTYSPLFNPKPFPSCPPNQRYNNTPHPIFQSSKLFILSKKSFKYYCLEFFSTFFVPSSQIP